MLKRSIKKGSCLHRTFLSNELFNDQIIQKIKNGDPFFACRYGSTELRSCFYAKLKQEKILDQISKDKLMSLKMSSGVFPLSENMYLVCG